MKTRYYEVRSEALKTPQVRALLADARGIANALVSTTGKPATINRVVVEGQDTDILVYLIQRARDEDAVDPQVAECFVHHPVEVHEPGDQIPIVVEGPIPWRVLVRSLEPQSTTEEADDA